VIGKYRDKFKNEFALISLLKTEQVSNYIFNRTLGRKAIRNLDKSSLIVRSSLNHSSIHSIVLLSICNLKPEASLIEEAKSNICEVLLEENEFKSFGYYNFCVLHHSFLKELYAENIKEKYRKALLYAIIQTTDNLVFKEGLVREVDKFDLADSTLENLLLLIEKIELKLISIDRKLDEDEYQKESQKAIDLLNIKKDSVAEGSNTRLLVEHHIAKIYFWKGDTDTSKNIFEELLSKYPDSDQCKLQLARIADNDKNYPEAERYVNEVLGGISKNKSLSIVLSFYDLISNSKYKESREKFIENRIEDFVSDISITLRSSFDHPYRVLSSLSSYLGFNIPEVFEELCSSLPVPDNASKNKKLMVAYADIQLALFRLYKYGNYPNKEHKLNATKLLAENYYIESQPSNDFENLKVAKFYIEIDKAEEAGLFLDKVVRKDPFYYQARAKQYRAVDHDKSLEAINSAIEGLERGECAKWFLSTFLNDKAETLKDRNNQEALKILELAIQKQSNRKTKDSWARKLNDWKSC